MLHLIIATHGPLAEALVSSARMIYGDINAVSTVSLDEVQGIEGFKKAFAATLQHLPSSCHGALVLCDLQSGTPYNVACHHAFADQGDLPLEVLSGVNLPMLLLAMELLEGDDLRQAAATLLEDGRQSIVHARPVTIDQNEDF